MNSGWIKLHRQIMENRFWKDKPFSKGQAWIDILMSTSYERSSFWVRGIEVDVKPGQCAMSTHTMAKRWGWSRKKVGSFLKNLETALQIEPQKSNVTTLINIVNWGSYQAKEPQMEPQRNHKRTSEEPIKEIKKLKNKSIVEIITYLNTTTGKNFRPSSKETQRHINARLNEGFTLKDFQTVIDNRFLVWGNDLKMSEYLRPATLFGAKFESYLQSTNSQTTTQHQPGELPDYAN